MTLTETKEMINSTIVENGKQEITGHALNLALTGTIDALSQEIDSFNTRVDEAIAEISLAGGSSTNEIVYYTEDSASTEASHNIAVYNKIVNGLNSGSSIPSVSLWMNYSSVATMSGMPDFDKMAAVAMTMYLLTEGGVLLVCGSLYDQLPFILLSDGTFSIE